MSDIQNLLSSIREESKSDKTGFLEQVVHYWLDNHIDEIHTMIQNILTQIIQRMFTENAKDTFTSIFTEHLQQELILRFYNIIINDEELKDQIANTIQTNITQTLIQNAVQEAITTYVAEKFSK